LTVSLSKKQSPGELASAQPKKIENEAKSGDIAVLENSLVKKSFEIGPGSKIDPATGGRMGASFVIPLRGKTSLFSNHLVTFMLDRPSAVTYSWPTQG